MKELNINLLFLILAPVHFATSHYIHLDRIEVNEVTGPLVQVRGHLNVQHLLDLIEASPEHSRLHQSVSQRFRCSERKQRDLTNLFRSIPFIGSFLNSQDLHDQNVYLSNVTQLIDYIRQQEEASRQYITQNSHLLSHWINATSNDISKLESMERHKSQVNRAAMILRHLIKSETDEVYLPRKVYHPLHLLASSKLPQQYQFAGSGHFKTLSTEQCVLEFLYSSPTIHSSPTDVAFEMSSMPFLSHGLPSIIVLPKFVFRWKQHVYTSNSINDNNQFDSDQLQRADDCVSMIFHHEKFQPSSCTIRLHANKSSTFRHREGITAFNPSQHVSQLCCDTCIDTSSPLIFVPNNCSFDNEDFYIPQRTITVTDNVRLTYEVPQLFNDTTIHPHSLLLLELKHYEENIARLQNQTYHYNSSMPLVVPEHSVDELLLNGAQWMESLGTGILGFVFAHPSLILFAVGTLLFFMFVAPYLSKLAQICPKTKKSEPVAISSF